MVKLLENTFRSVNIGMVNELALMCDVLGVDVYEVIDAAATKPFGFIPFIQDQDWEVTASPSILTISLGSSRH